MPPPPPLTMGWRGTAPLSHGTRLLTRVLAPPSSEEPHLRRAVGTCGRAHPGRLLRFSLFPLLFPKITAEISLSGAEILVLATTLRCYRSLFLAVLPLLLAQRSDLARERAWPFLAAAPLHICSNEITRKIQPSRASTRRNTPLRPCIRPRRNSSAREPCANGPLRPRLPRGL
jgi:hypothetical protein